MKKTFMFKAAFLLAQAVTLCGSLQAVTVEVKEKAQQVGDLTTIDYDTNFRKWIPKDSSKSKLEDGKSSRSTDPIIQHLYAFNTQTGLTPTTVVIPAGAPTLGGVFVGNDVPFNNGTGSFPPIPVVRGDAIIQLNSTDFLVTQNGDYLVTFFGYNSALGIAPFIPGTGVNLFVQTQPVGPAVIAGVTTTDLSFSEVVRITGASKSNPAIIEVKAVASLLIVFPFPVTLNLFSDASDGINATLVIEKLSGKIQN